MEARLLEEYSQDYAPLPTSRHRKDIYPLRLARQLHDLHHALIFLAMPDRPDADAEQSLSSGT